MDSLVRYATYVRLRILEASMRITSIVPWLFCLLFVAAVQAGPPVAKPVAADTSEKFALLVEQIHEEMKPGGRYEFIRPDEAAKVDTGLNKMAAILEKSGSVNSMTQVEKVQLFDVQENVNGILTHSDRDRLVCEHNAPVGTSIPRTTCQTVADIERSRRDSKKTLLEAGTVGSTCMGQSVCKSH